MLCMLSCVYCVICVRRLYGTYTYMSKIREPTKYIAKI